MQGGIMRFQQISLILDLIKAKETKASRLALSKRNQKKYLIKQAEIKELEGRLQTEFFRLFPSPTYWGPNKNSPRGVKSNDFQRGEEL
jgi:tmRNA-binding protein